MGWNGSTQILTYPFVKLMAGGLGDLETALGHASTSQADLFANGVVNKWAKYKAVKMTGLSYASQLDSNHEWMSTADWWKGYNGQCGLTFTTYAALGAPSSGFLAQLLAGALAWGYDRPAGGTYPLRAFDFIQYYAAAPKPVTGVYDNLRLYGGGKLTVQLDETRAANDLGIQLSDLVIGNAAVSGWYVGVLIWRSNSQYTFAFSTDTIGNGVSSVEFTGLTSYGGQSVKIVPFLASKRANQGVDPGAGVYLSCDVAPQTVTVQAEVVAVVTTIDAQWNDALHGRVRYVVNVINNTASAFTASNMVIELNDGSHNINTRSIGSISIPANSNQEYSGVFIVAAYDPAKTYKLVVTSSSSYVSGQKVVDEYRG